LAYGKTPEGNDIILTAHVGEEGKEAEFNRLLRELGISKTVVATELPIRETLNDMSFQ
jgi:hypothetical protein